MRLGPVLAGPVHSFVGAAGRFAAVCCVKGGGGGSGGKIHFIIICDRDRGVEASLQVGRETLRTFRATGSSIKREPRGVIPYTAS